MRRCRRPDRWRCWAGRRCRTASSVRGRRQAQAAPRPSISGARGRTCSRRRGKSARRAWRRPSRAPRLAASLRRCGIVRNQNAAAPTAPRASAATASFLTKRHQARRDLAIGLVAAAAICRRSTPSCAPSASTILRRGGDRRVEIGLELVVCGLEAGHVFPDFRRGLGVALVAAGREQARRRRLLPRWPAAPATRSNRRGIERRLAFGHLGDAADSAAALLHDGLAVGDRIGIGGRNGERDASRWQVKAFFMKILRLAGAQCWRASLTRKVAENVPLFASRFRDNRIIEPTEASGQPTKNPGLRPGFFDRSADAGIRPWRLRSAPARSPS